MITSSNMWCYCIMYSDGTTQYLYSANFDHVIDAITDKCKGTDIVVDAVKRNLDYPFAVYSERW